MLLIIGWALSARRANHPVGFCVATEFNIMLIRVFSAPPAYVVQVLSFGRLECRHFCDSGMAPGYDRERPGLVVGSTGGRNASFSK